MALWLSHRIVVGEVIGNFKSFKSLRSQMAFVVHFVSAIYSASVLESATDFCFVLDQLMVPPLKIKQNPEVDFLVSGCPPSSQHHYNL
jgi:hypothetical protein